MSANSSWKSGIIALLMGAALIISFALDAWQANAASIDGEWVGRGERTVCGNSQGTVDISIAVSSQAKQAGCPDCVPTTSASISVNGQSSNQTINISDGRSMNSGLNNVGSSEFQSWFVNLTRWGNPILGYRFSGTLERMNYDCRNLGTTGDKISVELHRP